MTTHLPVGEAKKRFSEIMGRVAYRGERFIIERRGKAMAALVPAEDLARLERQRDRPRGLLAAIGLWDDDEELERTTREIYLARERSEDRSTPVLED